MNITYAAEVSAEENWNSINVLLLTPSLLKALRGCATKGSRTSNEDEGDARTVSGWSDRNAPSLTVVKDGRT